MRAEATAARRGLQPYRRLLAMTWGRIQGALGATFKRVRHVRLKLRTRHDPAEVRLAASASDARCIKRFADAKHILIFILTRCMLYHHHHPHHHPRVQILRGRILLEFVVIVIVPSFPRGQSPPGGYCEDVAQSVLKPCSAPSGPIVSQGGCTSGHVLLQSAILQSAGHAQSVLIRNPRRDP